MCCSNDVKNIIHIQHNTMITQTYTDFEVKDDRLCLKRINEAAIVLIYSDHLCEYSKIMLNIIGELSKIVKGIEFVLVNVRDGDCALIDLSRDTVQNITAVPLLYYYINGVPTHKYIGSKYTAKMVLKFIKKVFDSTCNTPFLKKTLSCTRPVKYTRIPTNIIDYNICGDVYDMLDSAYV